MYHYIVGRIIRGAFRGLSRGDYKAATGLMAEHCHYHFVGRHALGGHRHSRALIETWFQRFFRLLPGFQFTPVTVMVTGWPWKTHVAVRLEVAFTLPDGSAYRNVALQMTTLKWFRAVDVLTVDDSQRLAEVLQELAGRFGIAEAVAAPIEG
jgi:ketosteroid isomerase-like protein